MKQSELDPCCFYYFHEQALHGVFALHVDNMVLGGSDVFMEHVVRLMREKFPFKHWITKQADFLGDNGVKKMTFPIFPLSSECLCETCENHTDQQRAQKRQGSTSGWERKTTAESCSWCSKVDGR